MVNQDLYSFGVSSAAHKTEITDQLESDPSYSILFIGMCLDSPKDPNDPVG